MQQLGDGRLERIEFAGALAAGRRLRRLLRVLGDRAAADVQMAGTAIYATDPNYARLCTTIAGQANVAQAVAEARQLG